MTKKTIGYAITTGLVTLAFAAGGVFDLLRGEQVVGVMAHLGYPVYLATILGAWKVLGAAAVAAPGLPRLKEWAYAGMVFDLTGAAISHGVAGDGVQAIATPLAILALVAASWALRPASRRLGTVAPAAETAALHSVRAAA